jgi:hypothetical protein
MIMPVNADTKQMLEGFWALVDYRMRKSHSSPERINPEDARSSGDARAEKPSAIWAF